MILYAMALIQEQNRLRSAWDWINSQVDNPLNTRLIQTHAEIGDRLIGQMIDNAIKKDRSGLPAWLWDVNPKLLFLIYLKNEVLK